MRAALLVLMLLGWSTTVPAAPGPNCPTTLPQEQLNECWIQAFEHANERLDDLLHDLKRSLGRNWAHLRESQSFWEKSRSIDCKVEASLLEGPVREAVRHGCSEKRTRERIRQLRLYLCPRYNLTGQCDAPHYD